MSDAGHEMRIFGPPGTGKTTALSKWIGQTVEKRGSDSVIACSFTKAAATELVGRGLPLDRSRIGTLHSFAYRAIGGGVIAEKKLLGDWNKSHLPYMMTDKSTDVDDVAPVTGRAPGDELFAEVQRLRAQMIPSETWEPQLQGFHAKWQQFKQDTGSIDFTDMIDLAYLHTLAPPLPCDVLFADECQDMTRLELALVRKWGASCQHTVLAGDDDQAIYWFKGALADAFLNPPIPAQDKRVLDQSYRVPRAVVAYANHWIRDVQVREEKDYAPRAVDGELKYEPSIQFALPTSILRHIEKDLARTVTLPDGSTRPYTVQILATCSYMLDKLKYELRRQGIPFANKYRAYRGDWNPLRPSKGIGIGQRFLAYMAPYRNQEPWTTESLPLWVAMVKADEVLARGAKTAIAGLRGERPLHIDQLSKWFDPDALRAGLRAAENGDAKWLLAHTLPNYAAMLDYPAKIMDRYGLETLTEEPALTIGTIHSVKGSQADAVYIYPDISPSGFHQWQAYGSDAHDSIIRTFYVGFTRAYEKLVLCGPSSRAAVRFPLNVPAPVAEDI
jgi:DNA helicase II / ATP-dependent DNA helicase PcrA